MGVTAWQLLRDLFIAKYVVPVDRALFDWFYRLSMWL